MDIHRFNFEKIKLPVIIRHKDKDYFLCTVRQKPIQSKPEENFRQQVITYLTDILGYPANYIDIEVPMTYFQPTKRGRADIIVYDRPFFYPASKPYILIECKAPDNNKNLDDFRHHQQLNNYNLLVKAEIIMLTNGNDIIIKEAKSSKPMERLPTFSEVVKSKALKFIKSDDFSWRRTTYKERFDKKIQSTLVKQGLISASTDTKILPYVIHLMDLFYDNSTVFKPQQLGNYELIRDCGLRPANYGYAFGAGLIGNYRFILLRQDDDNHRIVSFSIYHQHEWGTYLMIAVDDRQGHSIELRLDKYIKTSNSSLYDIWHNGSLTVGKKGRIKNRDVIEFLEENAPFLVSNDKVVLGTLDLSKDLTFEQPEVKDFILRAATYAILREQIRQLRQ